MIAKLGTIQKLDPREIWVHEAGNFTPWLAQIENIKLLGEALGLELEVDCKEAEVGPYRADILCKDVDGRVVVIENQLEITNHDHLGKLLTYAAGLDAQIIIWVATGFTEQHRAVLDWLNENANGKLNLFGIEIELLKIGDSLPAPRFNIISKPNDWTNSLKQIVREGELTDRDQTRLKYWSAFCEYLQTSLGEINCKSPSHRSYLWLKSPIEGYQGYRWGFEVKISDEYIDIFVGSYNAEKIAFLQKLHQEKSEVIAMEMGETLIWTDKSSNSQYWITVSHDCDPKNIQDWEFQHRWLKNTAEKMLNVFAKYLV